MTAAPAPTLTLTLALTLFPQTLLLTILLTRTRTRLLTRLLTLLQTLLLSLLLTLTPPLSPALTCCRRHGRGAQRTLVRHGGGSQDRYGPLQAGTHTMHVFKTVTDPSKQEAYIHADSLNRYLPLRAGWLCTMLN